MAVKTVNETLFAHAVILAAAFVQNGDIRTLGNTRPDSTGMLMTRDMIESAYFVIEQAYEDVQSEIDERQCKE